MGFRHGKLLEVFYILGHIFYVRKIRFIPTDLVLCLLEGGAGVLVLDTVLVSVWLRGELLHGFVVGGGGVVGDRGRLVGRGRRGRSGSVSQGNSHEGGGGADLKQFNIMIISKILRFEQKHYRVIISPSKAAASNV